MIVPLQKTKMDSIRSIYRIGHGPSSTHTMAPRRASETFRNRHPEVNSFRVSLYGSMAATGKGHLTDAAIAEAFAGKKLEIRWKPEEVKKVHPNGLFFEALDDQGNTLDSWLTFSTGGGALSDDAAVNSNQYTYKTMDRILELVPIIGEGTLHDAIAAAKAGITSTWGNFQAEGIVARPKTELKARNGNRIITKIKCRDFVGSNAQVTGR